MRAVLWSLGFATSLLTISACSDSTSNANCLGGGHGGAKPTCGPWADDVPEGGEARIELQTNGTDGTTTGAVHAYFFKDQMPLRRDLEGPEIVAGTGCTDVTGGVYFDNGSPPPAVALAATRTYLDAGPNFMITSADQSFTLAQKTNTADLSSGLTHKIVYLNPSSDGSADLHNHAYSVQWNGGALGAMDMTEPTAVQGVAVKSQLFVPPVTTSLNPSFASPLQIPKTGDWTLTYQQEATPADAPPVLQFAVFYDTDTLGVDYQCVSPANGTMVIPRAMIDKLKPTGVLYFGTFTHVGHLQDARRMDLVGVSCTYQEYAK